VPDGPAVVVPSALTGTAVAIGAVVTLFLGDVPGPILSKIKRKE